MVKKKKKKVKKKELDTDRTKEGKYPKGVCGNPKGRPKGTKNKFSVKELIQAIRQVEYEKDEPLLVHFVKKAYEDTTVLIALGKKLIPDLRSIEGLLATYDATMTDEKAEEIRKKMQKNYGNHVSIKKTTAKAKSR